MYLKIDDKIVAPTEAEIFEKFSDMFPDRNLEKVHTFRKHPSRIKKEAHNNGRLVTSIKGIKPDFKYTDPEKGKQVKVQYFVNTTQENIGGVLRDKYNPAVIYFDRFGEVRIDFTKGNKDYAKLYYMLLNPKRMKSSDATERGDFYYDDPERINELALSKEQDAFKVQQLFFDEKHGQYINDESLVGIAMRNGLEGAALMPSKTLRNTLLGVAKSNPKAFMEKLHGRHGHTLELVQTALDFKVLYFNSEKNTYHYTYRADAMNFQQKIADTNILYQVKSPMVNQPAQDFVNWLLEHDTTDAMGNLQQILEEEKGTLAMAPGRKQSGPVDKAVAEYAKGIQVSVI